MFSDTHFHYETMTSDPWNVDGVEMLRILAERNTFFALDIGTKCDDLLNRQSCIEKAVAQITDLKLADRVRDFCYFSAGIWPGPDAIHDRENQMKILRECIQKANSDADQHTLNRKIIAIGEGGLDHHWNPCGVDGRCESDFDEKTYRGERELFEMQLELAEEMNLPFIIHSRDAYEDTVDILKNSGYHNGIVHCYSYGLEEAKVFLDLGWYIAFGGSVTYTKKAKLNDMKELLQYVPSDRFLCETDSPYLTPVPLRGTPNSPVKIEHVYNFIAQARGTTAGELSDLVDSNIKKLFKL